MRLIALALAALATLAAFAIQPTTAHAASGWYHDWTYGATPRPLGDNNHVDGMATDGAGNVYVADNFNHRAQKFSSSLNSVLAFGTAAPGQGGVRNPQGVGVSPVDGSVYVTDSVNRKIEKFDAAGQSVLSFGSSGSGNGQFSAPGSVTVKSDGEVWVSDTGNNRVQRFSSAGAYLGQFGTAGAANGQFNGPRGGCFASDGTFYVADSGNNRIQRFSAVGAFMNAYGSVGSGNGQFQGPLQVGCDPVGAQFVVADTDNHRVQRFNASFTYVGQFGSNGTANGQFQFVHGVAIDATGRIWASDYDGSRVQVFSSAGAYVGQAGSDNQNPDHYKNVFGAAANDAGTRVYVSDTNNHRVQYYDGAGNWIGAWGTPGSANGQFALPYGMDVDGSGNVFVVDQQNHRVQKFTANGAHLLTIGSIGSGNGQLSYPWAVAVSPVDGSIYVTDNGNNRVQRFSSAGAYVGQVGSAGAGNGQFNNPHGISVDAAGNVYVADNGNNRIQRFTAALAYSSQFGTAGAADGQFSGPSGVAVLPDNTIVVVENSNPRLQQFSNAGAFLRKAGSGGIGTGQLGWPRVVTADASGAVYIADASNSRAVRWRLATAGPPNTLFVHDTDAQAGTCGGLFCVNPTDISAAQPHYSWINQYGATVTGQRTRVHTDTLAGVVGLWHLDGDGTDASGLGGTMTPVPGAMTYETGGRDFGSAARVASPGITVASTSAAARYDIATYTIEAWFRHSGAVSGFPFLIAKGTSNTSRAYSIFLDGGNQGINATYSSGGVARYPVGTLGTPYFDGLWHHVALVRDASTGAMRIYVDGLQKGSAAATPVPDQPVTGVEFGGGPPGWSVDELRVSNVVRSDEEIAGSYRTRLPHATLLWDSSPADTPVANGSCAAASRCADIVHGTGGSSPLGALRGGRFTAQHKQHDGTAWSSWSNGDWFEQTIGRPALGYVGDTTAATGAGNKADVLALNPRMSWTNNKGRTNGTVNRQRVQVVTTPLDDVIGLYHLDGSGADLSSLNNTLTRGAAAAQPQYGASSVAAFSQKLAFDGGDTASIPTNTAFDSATLTVETWFRTTDVTGGYKVLVGRHGANEQFTLEFSPTTLDFGGTADNQTEWQYASVPKAPYLDGQWHHAAGTMDATKQLRLYVDGALVASGAYTGVKDIEPGTAISVGYGAWGGGSYIGDLDEVRISSVARTAAEVRGYYETRRPHFATMWDSDAAAAGTVALASCGDLLRCADIPYSGGTNLRYADARYYARARYKASTQAYWTAWSDYDWFETDTPPAPTTFRTHDTNANPGSTNPTTIASTTPHFSYVPNMVQDAVAQRTQVVTTTLDDVVGLFHLDGSTDDVSATNNDLVLAGGANAPTYQAGTTNFGQALRFDGTDDASLTSLAAYDLDEFTVETWFSTTMGGSAAFPNMVSRQAGANDRNFAIFFARPTTQLCGSLSIAGTQQDRCVAAPLAWRDGSWHHVALTRTAAGSTVLYVDGVAQGTWALPGNVDNPVQAIHLGSLNNDYVNTGYVGDLDDVRVSSRARTAAELLGAYRTRRQHFTTMWDNDPTDAGAFLPQCASGVRCADQVYGTGGGQLPLVRSGARYFVRAKLLNEAGSWSAWGSDWFETSTTLTVGVDSPTRTLGPVLAGSDATATTVVTVTTNNATGYQLSAADSNDTWAVQKDASNSVVDWTGTDAAPTPWAVGVSGGFGVSVLGASGGTATRLAKWGTGTNTGATDYVNNLWAGLDLTSSTLLHQRSSEYVLPDTVTIAYRANVGAAQQAGAYTGTVTYTAVANP